MNTKTHQQLRDADKKLKVVGAYATATFTVLLALQLSSCASVNARDKAVDVPARLAPGAHEALTDIVPAHGVQIYECRANKDQPGTYAWAFVAPEANLLDENGIRIGSHYAGPHWEANDGSKIVGALKERADAPVANAIPWLLLSAKSVGAEGTFSRVTSIQRVKTAGGTAPKDGCTQASAGATLRVSYAADYYFFSARPPARRAGRQATQTHY